MQAALVTFDHLALAFLGCYGATRGRTPHFDRFASESVVFDQCFGVADNGGIAGGLPELVQQVQAAQGQTVIQSSGDTVTGDTGVREAVANWRRAADNGSPALLWLRSPGVTSPWTATPERIAAAWRSAFPHDTLPIALRECAAGQIEQADPEAMIAAVWPEFLNRGWLARDHVATAISIGRLRWCAYAAAVAALDRWLGEVLETLTADAHPDSLIMVAAASGDLTGPHGELTAGCPRLIDPLVHVPLLVRTGTMQDGARRNGLVSTSDLAPTLAEWLHIEPAGPAHGRGRSLGPLLRGEVHSIREDLLIGSQEAGWSLRTPEFACLSTANDLSLEFPEHCWLFVKPDDAWETLNVSRQLPEITAEYCRRMRTAAEESQSATATR